MTTIRTAAAAALLALAALTGPAVAADGTDPEDGSVPGRSDDGGHPVVMQTREQDCFEHNTLRFADWQAVAERLPEGWVPAAKIPGTGTEAGRFRTRTVFVDFTCESWSVDGLPARRTTVSWLAAQAVRADGSGGRRAWAMEHGSDNPLFVERMRKLGVESQHLPRSVATHTTAEDGTVTYRQSYVDDTAADGGQTYLREGTVKPREAASTSVATFWFDGERGPVSITYDNAFTHTGTPTTTERLQGSVFGLGGAYRMADAVGIAGNPNFIYTRGSWTGTLRLQPAQP